MERKLLPVELIITNFIEKEPCCNYELYLREFINRSSFFLCKSNGQPYEPPCSEANGECDCISDAYKLDFKLVASQSLLRAISDLSRRKTLLCPGVIAINSPRKKHDSQIATNIFAVLPKFSYTQLCQLSVTSSASAKSLEETDVIQFLSVLNTKKNLLLFLP